MTATVRPTKKQQELLVYIEQFIDEHGYSPSYREIMNGCQYNSVATVALHIGNLIKRGHLRKRDHSARSIEVVKEASSGQTQGNSGGNLNAMASTDTGEGWLLQQAEGLIHQAEQLPAITESGLEDISAVLRACSVLGLAAQIERLNARFAALRQKVHDNLNSPN
jgi:SOS-response transcriptional repressor LexA